MGHRDPLLPRYHKGFLIGLGCLTATLVPVAYCAGKPRPTTSLQWDFSLLFGGLALGYLVGVGVVSTTLLSIIGVVERALCIGTVARYQDGQHFSRVVIPTDLNRGPEPVQAFPSGDSRFTFVLTVDSRIEKGFRVGRGRLAAIFDVFNIPHSGIEVEEDVRTGPQFRTISAIRPPRAFRLGLRYER